MHEPSSANPRKIAVARKDKAAKDIPHVMTKTQRLDPDRTGIARAAEFLRTGDTVAFPTETVYGLGADATNALAVAKIFEAKGRPRFNPLIAHVPNLDAARRLIEIPVAAEGVIARFWPGPLTVVAPARPGSGIADLVTAGLGTLGVRVPAHPLAKALLTAVGRPVAAPSANRSGQISPTTAVHVFDGLGGRIAAVLDGGPCEVGLESTILGFEDGHPVLLRPGGIAPELLAEELGVMRRQPTGTKITAPGQLASHYAPKAQLRLNANSPREDELYLGFGSGPDGVNLSAEGDLREAAANFFALLRMLDARAAPGQVIAVSPVPNRGLGIAINDRLIRAAAPR